MPRCYSLDGRGLLVALAVGGMLGAASAAMGQCGIPVFKTVFARYDVGRPEWIVLGDVNQDDDLDVIVAEAAMDGIYDGVAVLLGHGDGTFDPPVRYEAGEHPCAIAIADLNGDNWPDAAVCSTGDGTPPVSVLMNRGDGTFEDPVYYGEAGCYWWSVSLGDIDGDDRADMAVTHASSVLVYRNYGDGSFGAPTEFDTGSSVLAFVALDDMNNNGWTDMVVTRYEGYNKVRFFPNAGDGWFADPIDCSPVGAEQMAITDVDDDGLPDLVTPHVSILLNWGYKFYYAADYPAGSSPKAVAAADLDLDGRIDLAVANNTTDTASILPGQGDGTFGPRHILDKGDSSRSIALADLNGDGWVDMVLGNMTDRTIDIYKNECSCPGDINDDEVVDAVDLNKILVLWGTSGVADLDGDGTTAVSDLLLVIETWGPCP